MEFTFTQRIEMAVALGCPISLIFSLILTLIWKQAILPFNILTWALSFLIFISFLFYKKYFQSNKNFGRGGLQLITWLILMLCLIGYGLFINRLSMGTMIHWGIPFLIVIFAITMDILGCTLIYKSGFHDHRLLKVIFDVKKCKCVGFCQQVCPGDCFEIDKNKKIATIPPSENCVQCGAYIVQCL